MARRAYWWHGAIQRPAWGGHISLVRGEDPPAGREPWDALEGLELDFDYDGTIETDGKHFWLPIFCETAGNIREYLGLPREPEYPFHLTFGVAEGG